MKKINVFKVISLMLFLALAHANFAQEATGSLRGVVKNKVNGEVLPYGYVKIVELNQKANVDENGVYFFQKLAVGTYTVVASYVGCDTFEAKVGITANNITKLNIPLSKDVYNEIGKVKIKGERIVRDEKDVDIGVTRVTQRDLAVLPSVGGEPDLLQYLQVLPGAVFTGDQGGQLYLRGGSPVMNKVLLDGMVIYNPFHSIGLFSVFDADFIGSADIYTAGFGAEYGGRISAVVDVKTRDGDPTKVKRKLSVNPFTSKFNIEGPIKKYNFGNAYSSYMFSYKTSYLKQTSSIFYPYVDQAKLPYTFNDLYGKISFNTPTGSHFKLFGFHFRDAVDFPNTTAYAWKSTGFGTKIFLLPEASKIKVAANLSYSNYGIEQKEQDNRPRESDISAFDLELNIINSLGKADFINGIEINGMQTNFQIFNANDRRIEQTENTTQFGMFSQYKAKLKNLVLDAGLRLQYYASLGNSNLEPRLQVAYNIIPKKLIFKAAAGRYSQNLLSASSDRDVVNLFYGFLSGPNNLPDTFQGQNRTHSLQKANHLVGGFDYFLNDHNDFTFEVYYKDFTQLTNINRDKLFENTNANADKPARQKQDYVLETGDAYGADFRYRYNKERFYLWVVYSLNYVTRNDGVQTYAPIFDRRHNINIVSSYYLSRDKKHVASVRWNYGTGFPFTQTQGFFEKTDFNNNGASTDYVRQNGDLGIVYGELNQGRLPQYHRMDVSYKWSFLVKKKHESQFIVSITNVYNRNNIFFFDRFKFERIDQLPILGSVGFNIKF